MKLSLSLLVLSSALVLSACGGDSDSSSFTGTKTLGNGNVYSCPSEVALTACTTDATCATSCTLTKENVKPVNPSNPSASNACETSGSNIFGVNGKSCIASVPALNGGADSTVDCLSNGTLIINNGLQVTNGSFNLNGFTFTCR